MTLLRSKREPSLDYELKEPPPRLRIETDVSSSVKSKKKKKGRTVSLEIKRRTRGSLKDRRGQSSARGMQRRDRLRAKSTHEASVVQLQKQLGLLQTELDEILAEIAAVVAENRKLKKKKALLTEMATKKAAKVHKETMKRIRENQLNYEMLTGTFQKLETKALERLRWLERADVEKGALSDTTLDSMLTTMKQLFAKKQQLEEDLDTCSRLEYHSQESETDTDDDSDSDSEPPSMLATKSERRHEDFKVSQNHGDDTTHEMESETETETVDEAAIGSSSDDEIYNDDFDDEKVREMSSLLPGLKRLSQKRRSSLPDISAMKRLSAAVEEIDSDLESDSAEDDADDDTDSGYELSDMDLPEIDSAPVSGVSSVPWALDSSTDDTDLDPKTAVDKSPEDLSDESDLGIGFDVDLIDGCVDGSKNATGDVSPTELRAMRHLFRAEDKMLGKLQQRLDALAAEELRLDEATRAKRKTMVILRAETELLHSSVCATQKDAMHYTSEMLSRICAKTEELRSRMAVSGVVAAERSASIVSSASALSELSALSAADSFVPVLESSATRSGRPGGGRKRQLTVRLKRLLKVDRLKQRLRVCEERQRMNEAEKKADEETISELSREKEALAIQLQTLHFSLERFSAPKS